MRKKQRHGGLSPHYVRLIRAYLRKVRSPSGTSLEALRVLSVWIDMLITPPGFEASAITRAKDAGISKGTVAALSAGLAVLRRKRLGRLWDWSPCQSFAALGITAQANPMCDISDAKPDSVPTIADRSLRASLNGVPVEQPT